MLYKQKDTIKFWVIFANENCMSLAYKIPYNSKCMQNKQYKGVNILFVFFQI